MRPLYSYFSSTYIKGSGDNAPLFPIELWDNRYNIFDDIPRTNNAVEDWYLAFRQSFGALNKMPRNFVKAIKKEIEVI